jgi:hypothetical protein
MAFSPWQPATMRSICSKAGAAALMAIVLLALSSPSAASDASAVEAGRSAGRALLILREPRVCGIALVHERCVADVTTFLAGKTDADFKRIPKIGPQPATGLRAFVTAGDRDGFDSELGWFNERSATAAMWRSDARSAALFDAGVEDVVLPAAQDMQLNALIAMGPIGDLADHSAQIPSGALPIPTAQLRSAAQSGSGRPTSGVMKFAHDLVAAVDTAMPAPPLARVGSSQGAAGDAALGMTSATVNELVDSPGWLAQADAQRFIDAYCARLAVVMPGRGADVAALRSALRVGESFSHDAALKASSAMGTAFLQSDAARAKPFVLGAVAAQMVYNAAILRDPRLSEGVVRLLRSEAALDAAAPGWGAARATAGGLAPTDWSGQYRAGLHLVKLIRSANAT